jgi:xanthine dehydrogenase iron-sulfur cluster and FAD-binding subunit A
MVQTTRVRDCSGYRPVANACSRMSVLRQAQDDKPDPQGNAQVSESEFTEFKN